MGGKQLGFSDYELTTAKKQTKQEKFLAEMDAVVPWQALSDLIEPHYAKTSKKGGRPPYPGPIKSHPDDLSAVGLQPSSLSNPLMS